MITVLLSSMSPISPTVLILAQSSAANATSVEQIPAISNIVGVSAVNGIKVSGINIGDADLSVTLSGQPLDSPNNVSAMSLPVTVIGAKFPAANITQASNCLPLSLQILNNSAQVMSSIGDRQSSAASSENPNLPFGATVETRPNTDTQGGTNILSKLSSLLSKAQLGTGNIVSANWSSPNTISMSLLGLGNIVTPSPSTVGTGCVMALVVPYVGMSPLSSVPLR
jgi:hypothetical protein